MQTTQISNALTNGRKTRPSEWIFTAITIIALLSLPGCNNSTPPVDPSALPNAPTGVTVTNVTSNSMDVSWNKVDNAVSYKVYYFSSDNSSETESKTTINTTYTLSDLLAEKVYYIWVTSTNAYGESAKSSSKYETTLKAPVLSAPTGITASVNGPSSVTVSWNAVTGATSYDVYYGKTSATSTLATTVSSAATSYQVTGLTSSTWYYFAVRAKDGNGTSSFSTAVSATTAGIDDLPAPTNPRATANGSSSVTVSWDAVTGATSYDVFYGTTSAPTTLASNVASTSTTYTVTGLTPETLYYFRVSAKNAQGSSVPSTSVSATTASYVPQAPSAPTNVKLTVKDAYNITISWDAVTGATSYDVYSGSTAAPTDLVKNTTTTSYTDYGLSAGTKYYYSVRAKNANGVSEPSTAVSAITVPAVPTGFKAVIETGTSNVLLSWNAVQGATDYDIYYGIDSSVKYDFSSKGATSYTMKAKDFAPGTNYSFCVRAKNSFGASSKTGIASITTPITYQTIEISGGSGYQYVQLYGTYPRIYYKVTLKAGVKYKGTLDAYFTTLNPSNGYIYLDVFDASGTQVGDSVSVTSGQVSSFGYFNYTSDTELIIKVRGSSYLISGACEITFNPPTNY